MSDSMFSDNISMFFASLIQGFRGDFSHPIGFLQIRAVGVSYLIAWLLSAKIHHGELEDGEITDLTFNGWHVMQGYWGK